MLPSTPHTWGSTCRIQHIGAVGKVNPTRVGIHSLSFVVHPWHVRQPHTHGDPPLRQSSSHLTRVVVTIRVGIHLLHQRLRMGCRNQPHMGGDPLQVATAGVTETVATPYAWGSTWAQYSRTHAVLFAPYTRGSTKASYCDDTTAGSAPYTRGSTQGTHSVGYSALVCPVHAGIHRQT